MKFFPVLTPAVVALVVLNVWMMITSSQAAANYQQTPAELILYNDAGSPIDLFWINPSKPDDLHSMGPPIPTLSHTVINSFHGHQFVIRFHDHAEGVEVFFTKGRDKEEITCIYDDSTDNLVLTNGAEEDEDIVEAEVVVPEVVPDKIRKLHVDMQYVHRKIRENDSNNPVLKSGFHKKYQNGGTNSRRTTEGALGGRSNNITHDIYSVSSDCATHLSTGEFSACMAGHIMDDINGINDHKTQLTNYRDKMSSRLRNYTCTDDTLETTAPLYTYSMPLSKAGVPHDFEVEVLLHKEHSKIWVVNDFVTDEECQVLMNHGRPLLRRATVAAEDGTSVVSENRKANQAIYHNFDLTLSPTSQDPLWELYNRVINVTNRHAGLNIDPPGQEPFTIIQYNKDDQYTPHCDGSCDFSKHKSTGRVATAVLYCKVADKGGATTFTKSNIFVKPSVGTATFFSYKGSDGRMDDGYTEHSGCPVLEGEKWITTAWMREGVTADNNWGMNDPSGVRIIGS